MLTINFEPFPQLITERLLLRRIESSDVNEVFILRSNKKVMQYIERNPAQSLEEAGQFIQKIDDLIKNNEAIQWAIAYKNDRKLVGTICIWNISKEHHRGEIGYMLHTDEHGKGIMQEALKAVINFGFNKIQLHSLEAAVNPQNLPSIKLLERNHFQREGYFKENIFFDGKFFDTVIYSLLAPQQIE